MNTSQFISAWNAAKTREEIAKQAGVTIQRASNRASHLRKKGFNLKRFKSGYVSRYVDDKGANFIPSLEHIARETEIIRGRWAGGINEVTE